MIPSIHLLRSEAARDFDGIFFDIDDTFTSHGKIPAVAFNALWAVREAGLKAVPITGRPAGWCDHIARMWPVDAVVGENGAFYFWLDEQAGKLKKRFLDPEMVRREKRSRLRQIEAEVLRSVPGTALASDQSYRETDLAIDFCEDVAPLDWSAIDRICAVFQKHGATCKVSSIHVNGWFGEYHKLGMTRMMARELWGLDLDAERRRFLFAATSTMNRCSSTFQAVPGSATCFASRNACAICRPSWQIGKGAKALLKLSKPCYHSSARDNSG